jgi:prophage regulatory protein
METHSTQRRALRVGSVIERTGFSKTHLYRLIERGQFPRSIKLSERVSVWDAELVDRWLAEKLDGVKA